MRTARLTVEEADGKAVVMKMVMSVESLAEAAWKLPPELQCRAGALAQQVEAMM